MHETFVTTTNDLGGRAVAVADALTDALTGALTALVDDVLVEVEGQLLLPKSRYVDLLLDMYNATPVATIRELIGERMNDVRHLNVVDVDDVRADMYALVATAAFEATVLAAAAADFAAPCHQHQLSVVASTTVMVVPCSP
jgi:hypothetical protein